MRKSSLREDMKVEFVPRRHWDCGWDVKEMHLLVGMSATEFGSVDPIRLHGNKLYRNAKICPPPNLTATTSGKTSDHEDNVHRD